MDVLTQAASVLDRIEEAERSGTGRGQAVLTFDLSEPAQRAAYAAAVAVLYAHGVDPLDVLELHEVEEVSTASTNPAATPTGAPADAAAVPSVASRTTPGEDSPPVFEADAQDDDLQRAFKEALAELTPDETRRSNVVGATYPRVRDSLRDGANVAAVAQVQYRRWLEEQRDRASDN